MSSVAVRISTVARAKYESWLDSLPGDSEDADLLLRTIHLPDLARSAIGKKAMKTGRGIECEGPANAKFIVGVRRINRKMIEVLILDVLPPSG